MKCGRVRACVCVCVRARVRVCVLTRPSVRAGKPPKSNGHPPIIIIFEGGGGGGLWQCFGELAQALVVSPAP